MLDTTYPLFGCAVFLTTMCTACLWGRVSQLNRRIAVLEAPPSVPMANLQPPPPPPIQIYIPTPPPPPSAPPALSEYQGIYYQDGRARTAVI